MSKEKAFIISDVHGCFNALTHLLTHWNPDEELLILNGDLVDRGANSKYVIELAYKYLMEDLAVVNWGNHDRMFYDFLTMKAHKDSIDFLSMYQVWYWQGGRETSASILGMAKSGIDQLTPLELQSRLNKHEYVKDLMGLMSWYYLFGDNLVVHAGVPVEYQENYEATPQLDLIWERDFYLHPNKTGKTIISGHTPTRLLHKSNDIWCNQAKDIYMIDGGCAYKGQLNALVIDLKGNVLNTYKAEE